ncbi:MAG: efflux RND transporter permease subunit [Deltaproteobacteria bacterium]|nr:efflux RND transporter permease subunit [Deltaproteobacteria bacterium]
MNQDGQRFTFNLPRWSLRKPTVIILVTVFFVVWGIYSYFNISRREDPEIKIAAAMVITIYPGASAEKVEEQVTRKLEEEIEEMDKIHKISSTTRENISVIFVEVDFDADTDMEWQKLRAVVAEVRPNLPETVIGPDVWDKFGDTTGMIISLKGAESTVLANLADELKAELRSVRSAGDVSIYGKIPEVVYVEGTRAEMSRYGITTVRLSKALEMNNLRIPGGTILTDRFQFRVEPTGAYQSVKDIEDTVIDVSEKTGQPIHVKDLFKVRRASKSPPDTKVLKDGEIAVAVGVMMKRGFNIVEMGRDIRQVLDRFRVRLPRSVSMEVTHDSPRHVNEQINDFMTNLLEGIAIVIVCMALFVGWRSASISAVAIPLSVLIALALMPVLDIDLEMVSIAAFIVSLGMLVDDSILVVDAVDIKLREGLSPREAAWRGTSELAAPVVAGTVGTVIAFLPMLLMTRETGAYVRSLPIVVSIALLASLVLCQTVTPLIAQLVMKRPKKLVPIDKGWVARVYRRAMTACLRRGWIVALVSVLALGGAGVLFKIAGFSFFPDAERDQFTVEIWLKEGSTLAETERVARLADQQLRKDSDVASTLVYIGGAVPRFYITVKPEFQKKNYAQIMVNTVRPDVTPRVIDRFNGNAHGRYPGARVFAKKLVMGMPIEAPVAFRIVGPDFEIMNRISAEIQDILRATPGAYQVRDNVGPDVPSLKIDVDQERASRVGVTNTDVAIAFLATYQGFELTRFNMGDEEIPVILRLADEERSIDQDLNEIPVASNITGEKVPLGNIASIEPQWGPGVIKHYNGRRALTVLAWNRDRLANSIVEEAMVKIKKIRLEPGYHVEIAGEKEEMDRAFKELLIIFGVIIISLIGLLVIQLGTIKKAIIVLLAVPLSVVGASLGLFFGGYSFSFPVFLGIVSLAGIVIKDSVVFVDFVERARARGLPIKESLVQAGVYRIRPIILTTVTTIGGLLPLALFGGVLFEPMAWTMIAGLTLATVLTLVVIPIYYFLLVRENPSVSYPHD